MVVEGGCQVTSTAVQLSNVAWKSFIATVGAVGNEEDRSVGSESTALSQAAGSFKTHSFETELQ